MTILFLLLPILVFLFNYILYPSVIRFALKQNYIDIPDARKRHKEEVPPVGGWLIYFSFLFSVLFIFPVSFETYIFICSATILFLLGLFDDVYDLNPFTKLMFQLASIALMVYLGGLSVYPIFSKFNLSSHLINLITVFLLALIMNSYNLVDGVNGLSALLGISALGTFSVFFYISSDYHLFVLGLCIIASLLAFLRYNVVETKVFLGDSGSLLVGLFVSTFSIFYINRYIYLDRLIFNRFDAEFGLVAACVAIPLFDLFRLVAVRGMVFNASPFKADRRHIHHLLMRLGLNHLQTSMLLFSLSLLIIVLALFSEDVGSIGVLYIVIALCFAFMLSIDYLLFDRYSSRGSSKTLFNQFIVGDTGNNGLKFYLYLFVTSVFLLALSIPFHRVSTSIPTLFLIITSTVLVLQYAYANKRTFIDLCKAFFKSFFRQKYTILTGSYILFCIFHNTFIISSNGWGKISIYFLLLVYWVNLFFLEREIYVKPKDILNAYIIGCAAFGLFILSNTAYYSTQTGFSRFFYSNLLDSVKASPIIHSMYYNLAILFVGNNFVYIRKRTWKILYYILLLFFVFMVYLCSSKLGLFLLPFCVFFCIYKILKNKKLAFYIAGFGLLLVFSFFTYRGYFSEQFIAKTFASRIITWKACFKLIKEHWLVGIGIGNSIEVLASIFKDIGYEYGIEKSFNAQNQFIESFLELGIVGLLFIFSFLYYGFKVAFNNRNILYTAYLGVVLAYMCIESLFQTQMGMVSFAFFNALFLSAIQFKRP